MSFKNYLKQKNVNFGIVIFTLVTFISYVSTSYFYNGRLFYADLQFIAGALLGGIYTLVNRKEDQSLLKNGAIVGIAGGFFSSAIIAFYDWLIVSSVVATDFITLLFFIGFTCLSGIPCGLIIGMLVSVFFMYKELKGEKEEEDIDEDFFEDLIEK